MMMGQGCPNPEAFLQVDLRDQPRYQTFYLISVKASDRIRVIKRQSSGELGSQRVNILLDGSVLVLVRFLFFVELSLVKNFF